MRRIAAILTVLALLGPLSAGAGASSTKKHGAGRSSMSMSSMSSMSSTKTRSCPQGKKWVSGYTKKDGTKVKGYCR